MFPYPVGCIQSGCMLYAGLVILWPGFCFESIVYSIDILLLFIFECVSHSFLFLNKETKNDINGVGCWWS